MGAGKWKDGMRRLGEKTLAWKLPALSPAFCAGLAGTLAGGLFAQGMGLFNKFSWHDDIFSLFMTGTAVPLGRWMLYVFAEMEKWFYGNGHFSLPAVNGMIGLICIGLSAGLLASFFRIRSRTLSALLGAVMAAFPVVTALFGFMYTAHYYLMALLMVVGGGILVCGDGGWGRKIAGTLLCGCGIGVYQAFLPVLLMLVLISQIRVLCLREESSADWAKRLLIQALCVAGVMGVYFAGSKYFLWKTGLQLDDYLGIDEMVSAPLTAYLARVGRAYREFFLPTHFSLWDMYPQSLYNLYRLMLCMDLLLGGFWILRIRRKSRFRAVMLGVMLALVPLGCNFIFVMSEEIHSLMVYGQVMQVLLLVCLADWTETPAPAFHRAVSCGTALLLAVSSLMYIRYDNQCYLKTAFQQQEAISWNTTLVSRIESAEGYRDELPVAFVNRDRMSDRNLHNLTEFDFIRLAAYEMDIQGYLNDWAWERFLANWCGFQPEFADGRAAADWPEVQAMPCYPDDGSIRVIRNTVVVKFQDPDERTGKADGG